MQIANDEARRTLSFARIAMALVALGGTLALTAPACSSTSSGGGSGDSCNEDDVCDEEEDCECSDCAGTSFCDTGTGGSTSASTTAATGSTSATTGASTTAATTSAATTTATSATSSTSSGGAFMCGDVSDTTNCPASDPAGCLCLGCELAACDDGMGGYNDCVCANCAADPYCSDAANCQDDGVCDPGFEGCVCADCAGHPLCG